MSKIEIDQVAMHKVVRALQKDHDNIVADHAIRGADTGSISQAYTTAALTTIRTGTTDLVTWLKDRHKALNCFLEDMHLLDHNVKGRFGTQATQLKAWQKDFPDGFKDL